MNITYKRAAELALDCQDACNLSGVVHSFADAVRALWDEAHATGKGTAWVNEHPIVTLFLDKLVSLNGKGFVTNLNLETYHDATNAAKQIAERS